VAQSTRLQAVGEETAELVGERPALPAPQPSTRSHDALTALLITTLKTLSQRTVIALANLGDLALMASVFVLWLMVIGQPTVPQLIGVGGYAAFALVALWARRR